MKLMNRESPLWRGWGREGGTDNCRMGKRVQPKLGDTHDFILESQGILERVRDRAFVNQAKN